MDDNDFYPEEDPGSDSGERHTHGHHGHGRHLRFSAEDPGITSGGTDAEVHLRDVVVYLARSLVDQTDEVVVASIAHDHSVALRLQVAEGELGKVIGRQGRTARAIRAAVMIAAAHHDVRVSLDIEG